MATPALFPNYMQMGARLSVRAWRIVRLFSISGALGLAALLFVRPQAGLIVLWGFIVPLLPLFFLVAPGLWRNICPLAAANQTPRVFGFTRGWTAPRWLSDYGYVIGVVVFFAVVASRKTLFNESGPATAVLLLSILSLAFVGGFFLKGKSGWCSSMCPLLPVQRLYGQTPFAVVRNSHCEPCVGCTKNCYDFNPTVAYMADQYEDDIHWRGRRRLFAGAFPGLILGFFIVPDPPSVGALEIYGRMSLFVLASAGSFFVLDALFRASPIKLTTLYAAAALNIFYWFAAPPLFDRIAGLWEAPAPGWVDWTARGLLLAATVAWVLRTYGRESLFRAQTVLSPPARVHASGAIAAHRAAQVGRPEVTFLPALEGADRHRVVVEEGATLLEIAERDGLPIEAGCRMGMCGSDPVTIVEGIEALAPVGGDEADTLARLGHGSNTRMACCARVHGDVTVSLTPQAGEASAKLEQPFELDPSVTRVVILGNGISGVTAADHIRRRHPDCEIDVVGREKHHLYNRMAISRLIYGRSAMQGLYLLPEEWYEEHRITCWLNTRATSIDRDAKRVLLGTGESLDYDRLILAMGSRGFTPPIEGLGLAGTFVLREADDAMHLRAFVQEYDARTAVVAGGGLLGLEAAYALLKLGLGVSVVELADRLMPRQLDVQAGEFLGRYLHGLGIELILDASVTEVEGGDRVERAVLADGSVLPCDLFLVSAGIRPNVDLAHAADLEVNRAVVVNDHMLTSDLNILAAGDVAEFQGNVYGLWPAAVEQAKVAAINAVGGDAVYSGVPPVTMLKVAGVDLTSIGRFEAESNDDVVIALSEADAQRYRKLVISNGEIVGAILLGHPLDSPGVSDSIKEGRNVSAHVDELRAGNWGVLAGAR